MASPMNSLFTQIENMDVLCKHLETKTDEIKKNICGKSRSIHVLMLCKLLELANTYGFNIYIKYKGKSIKINNCVCGMTISEKFKKLFSQNICVISANVMCNNLNSDARKRYYKYLIDSVKQINAY